MTETVIYKLVKEPEWQAAKTEGVYRGSAHDKRDGFIHFSTAAQLAETARKHFMGIGDLMLLAVDIDALERAVRWEPARGGELFPHLYTDLPIKAVKKAIPIRLGDDGIPLIPADLPK